MKKEKIYIAVLNQGWIRVELFVKLLKWISESQHDIFLSTPTDKPVDNNRNKIVKNFLESDCEFLLMFDDDTVPEKSPFDLIEKNKDIIILPTPIYQKGVYMLNIYDLDKDKLISIKNKKGFIEIFAGGTGCILIKRKVLEQIKAPFERVYDEEGIATLGQDLYFCVKAREKKFKIFSHLDYMCSHFKNSDIKKML